MRWIFMADIKKKSVPRFKSDEEERNFWATADSTKYVYRGRGTRTKLTALKPSLKII